MAVGPDDIHTGAVLNVNLDAGGFFSRVERSGHFQVARSALGLAVATVARRNGISMWAGFRVAKERADTLVQLRADDVLELAGLRVRLGVVDGKRVLEEAFGQAVTAHHVARALAAHGRELHF